MKPKIFLMMSRDQTQSLLTFPKHITLLCHQSRLLMSIKPKVGLEGIQIASVLFTFLHCMAKLFNFCCVLKGKNPLLGIFALCSRVKFQLGAKFWVIVHQFNKAKVGFFDYFYYLSVKFCHTPSFPHC